MKSLKELIKDVFNSSIEDDKEVENQFETFVDDLLKLGYENVSYHILEDGRWYSDGDEENLEDFLAKLTVENETFFISVDQTRSDGPEPYYNNPEITSILTKEEYENSNISLKADFVFNDVTVSIFSNDKAKIGDVWFENTEKAIKSLI